MTRTCYGKSNERNVCCAPDRVCRVCRVRLCHVGVLSVELCYKIKDERRKIRDK